MILISACLLGRNVKYSGGNNLCPWLAKYYNTDDFIAICPLSPSARNVSAFCRYPARLRKYRAAAAKTF